MPRRDNLMEFMLTAGPGFLTVFGLAAFIFGLVFHYRPRSNKPS